MSDLFKVTFQKQLTPDTVDHQFCSDWLKNQILDLFTKNELLEEELKWRRGFHGLTGVDELKQKLHESETERLEQSRLLGMEGSKEARLLAKLEEAKTDALKFGRAMEEERNKRLILEATIKFTGTHPGCSYLAAVFCNKCGYCGG